MPCWRPRPSAVPCGSWDVEESCALPPATPPLHLSHDAVLDATRRRACVATSPLTFHILCNAAGVGPGATSAVRRYFDEIARAKKQRGTARSDDKGPVGAKRAATTGVVRVLSDGAHIWR